MFNRTQILEHLNETDPDRIGALYREADRVRRLYVGDGVHLRGLIEFSNHCFRDCLYCGLRKSGAGRRRYRMDPEEIFQAARLAKEQDIGTVVLQSGEDSFYGTDEICGLVRRIKTQLGAAVTLSIGEKSFEEYRAYRQAGADRYLLKFETSDRALFARLKPDASYENRFRCLDDLRRLGYQVGSGVMVGLPGQTAEILADDILKFAELDLDMIGIGPFIPHPDTPLKGSPAEGAVEMVLKTVALTRILTRDAHLPATTALATADFSGRQKALACGANVVMPNVTPMKYRVHYEIYPNKACLFDSPEHCVSCLEQMAGSLGRTLAAGPGHRRKQAAI